MRNLFLLVFIGLLILTGCNNAKPVKTLDNLKAGIKGETTASAKYAAFAQKAKEEGNLKIAKLFEAASKSEAIHAKNHTKVLNELGGKMEAFKPQFDVKTTAEILQAAIDGETYEVVTMYPQFLSDAKAEKAEKATKSFTWAIDTEKKHQQLYTYALQNLKANHENALASGYAICPVCGNTYAMNSVDAKCSFCQTGKDKFIIL